MTWLMTLSSMTPYFLSSPAQMRLSFSELSEIIHRMLEKCCTLELHVIFRGIIVKSTQEGIRLQQNKDHITS